MNYIPSNDVKHIFFFYQSRVLQVSAHLPGLGLMSSFSAVRPESAAWISWVCRDTLCSHCTFVTVAWRWDGWSHYEARRQAALMSPSQWLRWEQGHPRKHRALCHRGASPLAVPACCHIVQDFVCIAHLCVSLMRTNVSFFTSSRHNPKQCRTK